MSGGRTAAVLAVCLVAAPVAACSRPADPAPATSAVASSPSPQATVRMPADAAGESPGDSAATPGGPSARDDQALVQVPVQRPGALPAAQRLSASPVPFDGRAVYSDGVALQVRAVTSGTSTATGAGAQPGQDVTSLTLALSNGSATSIDLTGVVVSASYGPSDTPADPVYGEGQEDFAGTAEPGGVLSARYSFAIPSDQLDDVTVTMDFDGRHAPAVWRGELR